MAATPDAPDEQSSLTAEHRPPYEFDPAHGYRLPCDADVNTRAPPSEQRLLNPEVPSDDDSLYDSTADELSDAELADANPQDYTKTYNRQRRQLDPAVPGDQKPKTNPQKPKANISSRIDDQISSLAKHAGKLRLDETSGKTEAKGDKDRADRATSEQVLDPRTRMILLQMINRGVVSEVNGCVSTGKEANVYHAIATPPDTQSYPVAIKIFKTAILTFRARSAYLDGEHRFKSGYKQRSNHAMVRMWAEKEFRNLKRLHAAGLPVPEPLYLKAHVLVMRFLGSKKGWSAPLLRDIVFSEDEAEAKWIDTYREVVRSMRIMYQQCRLVHADLSEYNMLYHSSRLWIIDVGQAVEHDHPRSLEFLRTDIKNVTRFFALKGVGTLAEQSVFGFITAESGSMDSAGMNLALDELEKVSGPAALAGEDGSRTESDTAVFRQQYIPQNLNQVFDVERDADKVHRGEVKDLVYQSLLPSGETNGPEHKPAADGDAAQPVEVLTSDEASDAASDAGESSASGSEHDRGDKQPRGKRFEDKTARKEHKAAVKEEKREKRKTKMPKKEKKRLTTTSSRGHRK